MRWGCGRYVRYVPGFSVLVMSFYQLLELINQTPELRSFIETDLAKLILVSLSFGFAVLLVEIRLPLKYYWDLPLYVFQQFFNALILRRETPIWGYCIDSENSRIIPLAAVELMEVQSKKVINTAYSNRLGQYGFAAKPGRYILRAVKNYYSMPPMFDPENIELLKVGESFALPVEVGERRPQVNLKLQPLEEYDPLSPSFQAKHYFKTFVLNLANGFLLLSILLSLFAWAVTREFLYDVLIAVGVALLFIKIYILETVGTAASAS